MRIAPLSPGDPERLGDFELLGRIGHGGMGQVYLGESPGGEPAAVKVIRPAVADAESRERFAQEIEILKTVWGARIAALLDADPEADRPWLATEYVPGPDLRRHVERHGPLPAVLAAALGATLAEALATVHKQKLLHRDLKPANILLGPNGPKIIDFGLAAFTESTVSLTAPHTVVGTPVCMAPEQANGERPLGAAVDVYALGAVLLFAAAGHFPYQAEQAHIVFGMITDPDLPPDLSGAPEELLPLLTEMLAFRAADRPSLPTVVRRCRALIEAQGLTVAEARRRLTAFTAAPGTAGQAVPAPAVPGAGESGPGTPVPPSSSSFPSSPALPAPPLPQQGDPTGTAVPPAPAPPPASAQVPLPPGNPGHPPGGRPSSARHGRPGTSDLRHSREARRAARELREAYAAGAAF
ncbi:serine/threonine-protein kinase [Streptomyces aidingensis]|uniref:Serine/threonine protein kinase n=1 Tax=Streptomyces aidingensis TaxID=910347 RepID=A0A1I1TJ73_9ACTN|nr:serine/threonine-protein kinase [Streptomyces aidingensis]SFD58672.1 Serine/threonine protein kinase [Streptomyces aidingensis]